VNLRNQVLNLFLFSSIQNVLSVENILSLKIITLPPFERCRAEYPTTRSILCSRDTRQEGLELLQAWITGCVRYQHNTWKIPRILKCVTKPAGCATSHECTKYIEFYQRKILQTFHVLALRIIFTSGH
jgi:hypothetical protein